MVSNAAFADEVIVDLPQTADAPVAIRQPIGFEGKPEDALQVFVGRVGTCCQGKTPMAGRYVRHNDVLSFTPAFGFSASENYVVRIVRPEGAELVPFGLTPDDAKRLLP